MRVENCYFCGRPAFPSKGITFNRNDGKAFRFCRSKCHKNYKMKRSPRLLSWTKASRIKAGKEMTVDSTLQFGARRNVPTRYDRVLWEKTVKAMRRIEDIRSRRERVFYKKRMAGNKERKIARARKLVAENEHLLPRLRGSEKRALEAARAEADEEVMDVDMEGIDQEEVDPALVAAPKRKSKVFGGEVRRLRARVDGSMEEA